MTEPILTTFVNMVMLINISKVLFSLRENLNESNKSITVEEESCFVLSKITMNIKSKIPRFIDQFKAIIF